MRHRDKINHLGRKYGHRKSMLTNMAVSLIMTPSHRINTTVAKAKVLRTFVEPIITAAKALVTYKEENAKDDAEKKAFKIKRMATQRYLFSKLREADAVKELATKVIEKVYERPGGYTRILKTGFRLGDNAQTCLIELVDFNEAYTQNKKGAAKPAATKTTRRSRKKKVDAAAPAAEAAETKAE